MNRLMNGMDEYYCLRTQRLCIVTRDYRKICGSVCRVAHLANTQIKTRYYYTNFILIVCYLRPIYLLLARLCACDETLRTTIEAYLDRSNCIFGGALVRRFEFMISFGGYDAVHDVVVKEKCRKISCVKSHA